jgi:hypothetical protein
MSSIRTHACLLAAGVSIAILFTAVLAKDAPAGNEAAKLLPEQIGNFKAVGAPMSTMPEAPGLFGEGSAIRTYASESGLRYQVQIQNTENDSEAFALLTHARSYFNQLGRDWSLTFNEFGTASFQAGSSTFFYKGSTFASVAASENGSLDQVRELARELAQGLDAGEGEIPVLVKHLPDWQTASQRAIYSVTLDDLKHEVTVSRPRSTELDVNNESQKASSSQPQPVLDVLSFDGGTEAVAAKYGRSQLVIVEFTTPQFSIENDSRIWTKIAELKSQGQPSPNAYRRVGNYSVFVFNAPDDKTANALVEQVKYEQVVQWLGDDPHMYDKLQKYLTQTSAGVLIAVLKSSGLSLVLCLGIGGLLGTLLFRHRRAQRAAAFSDAGGSVRLNLDELTGPANSHRLLSPAERSGRDASS